VYTGRSFPHTWYPERQLFGILNAYALLQLGFKVRRLAYRTHWRLERQSSHTGRFLLLLL
jgi:arylamine N-acetyltransferase